MLQMPTVRASQVTTVTEIMMMILPRPLALSSVCHLWAEVAKTPRKTEVSQGFISFSDVFRILLHPDHGLVAVGLLACFATSDSALGRSVIQLLLNLV